MSAPDAEHFKIELVDGQSGRQEFQANFYGSNSELVWWTEGYPERRDAVHAIMLLKERAAAAPIVAAEGVAGDEELVT